MENEEPGAPIVVFGGCICHFCPRLGKVATIARSSASSASLSQSGISGFVLQVLNRSTGSSTAASDVLCSQVFEL